MAAESLIGLSSMENDMNMLSSEKQIIENDGQNFKMSVADMEKEREVHNNDLKDTIDNCTILSSELEKAMLTEDRVHTLLAENQKLKNNNSVLLAEHGDLKAQLQNLDMECCKLRETIIDTKAENESLIKEKYIVESKVQQLKMDLNGLSLEKEKLVDNLNKKLNAVAQEKVILMSEKNVFETAFLNTESKLKEKDQQISNLQATINDLEAAKIDLHNEVMVYQQEKTITLAQLQQVEASSKNLQNQLEQQVEKNSEMQKTNEDLVLERSKLQHEVLEMQGEKSEALASIVDLESKLVEAKRSLQTKIAALHEENDATLLELHASQASVRNIEIVLEEQHETISSLQQANDKLQKTITTLTEESEKAKAKLQEEIKAMDKQLTVMRKSLHAKIAALHEEKDAALLELQAVQASVRNFESVVEKQDEDISYLHRANDDLQNTICTMTEETGKAKAKLQEEIKAMDKQLMEMRRSLHAKIAALHEQRDAALLELQASHTSVKNFESVVEKQSEEILSLRQANDDMQKTICTLTVETEKAKTRLQEEVKAMEKQLVEMRRSLHAKIEALHEEKDAALLDLQASQAYVRNIDSVVEKHNKSISSHKQAKDELQKAICTLTEKSGRAKALLQEELVEVRRGLHAKVASLHEEKDAAHLKLQATQASIRNFESVVEEQSKTIASLQQANDELQRAIYTLTEQSTQTKAKLQEEVNAMEIQLVELRRSLHIKIAAVHEEKDAAQLELQTSQASVRNIEGVVVKQNETISSLQQANDELQKTITTLTEESEKANAKLQEEIETMDKQLTVMRKSLRAKIATLHEEKDAALLEAQASVRNFESVVKKQNEDISYLHRANDDLQNTICTMTEETGKANAKLQDEIKAMDKQLVEMRRSLHAKIAALHEERDAALLELQASQTSVKNFESVVEKQSEEILTLRQANDDMKKTICTLTVETEKAKAQLQKEVKAMKKQLVEMRRSLHAKIAALHEEKDAALLDLQASQAYVRNIDSVVEKHNKSISSHKQAKDELQKALCTLTEKSERANAQLQEELLEVRRGLHAKVASLHEEKDAAHLKLQVAQASIRNFESVVEEQNKTIASIQQDNDELQRAIYTLTEQSMQTKAKLQEEVIALEIQLMELRRSLHVKIAAVHEEKDAAQLELQTSQASVRNIEGVVVKQNETISSLRQANDELQKTITTLTEESEKAKAKLQEEIEAMDKQLVEMRRSLHAKVAALHEEKDAAQLKLQESQASIRNFESVIEKKNKTISSLHEANDDLRKTNTILIEKSEQAKAKFHEQIEAMDRQFIEMRRNLHAKVASLHEENDAILLKLQASQASVRNFKSVGEKQNGYIASLQQANDVLQKEISTLTEQSQQVICKLQEEVKAAQEEKDMVISQLKQSDAFIKNLENEVARLIKELSVQLEKNYTLDKQLQKFQAEMAKNIVDLSLNTKALENTINVLSSEKTKVEEDLKMLVQACSGNMSSMKEFEDRVKQRIADDVTKLGPLYQSLGEVLSSYRKLRYEYDEMSTRASQLEVLKENQMEQIDKINQLKEEKLNTFMENTKLHKNVLYLEFQLQHVKQKLMENKWKEDRFANTLVTSQAEIQNLEQLVSLLEETLEDVKEHAELGVLSLTEQLDKLESSFNQGFPRFVYRSSTSSEEIKVLRKKLQDHLDQQKELLKKKEELAIRLRNKEKVLSEMVKNDVETRNLEKEVDEKESGGDRTINSMVTTSKRWPSLRRRRWRRNSYSC